MPRRSTRPSRGTSPEVTGLLLDTHAVMWWLTDDATLPDDVKARLDDDPDVWISSATVWEVAIKRSIGKIVEPDNLADEIAAAAFDSCRSPSSTRSRPGACPSSTVTRSTGCSSPRPGARG